MARILIVDDEPQNRELLVALLDGEGHELAEAGTGESALAKAAAEPPDLVLCDVVMPGQNGFEITRLLKQQAGERWLPVVLVTALSDPSSRLLGLRVGADEFLTKPVDRSELKVRVGNLLKLCATNDALQKRNRELEELHRLKDEMAAMLVHDLKNPMAVVLSSLDYVIELAEGREPEVDAAARDGLAAGRRVMRLLANLLDVTRMEAGRFEPRRAELDLAALLTPLVEQRALMARAHKVELRGAIRPGVTANVDGDLVVRVVENLLDNALRHTPREGRVEVALEADDGRLDLRVANSGSPIPPELRAKLFEKFERAEASAHGMNLGLGLYFCRLAAEAHGGGVWIEEGAALPTVFRVSLPRWGAS